MNRFVCLLLMSSMVAFGAAPKKSDKPAPVRIEVAVTDDGFVVANAPVLKVDQPVTLVVTRKVDATCAKDVVIKEFAVNSPLPLNKPVEVSFTPKKKGSVHLACPMDMITADLKVE